MTIVEALSPPVAAAVPEGQPRYFTNVTRFKDATAYLRVEPDGRVTGVQRDGEEWAYTHKTLAGCLVQVEAGVWRELTAGEAVSLIVRPPAAVPEGQQDRYRWERPAMKIVEAVKLHLLPAMDEEEGGWLLGRILDLTDRVRSETLRPPVANSVRPVDQPELCHNHGKPFIAELPWAACADCCDEDASADSVRPEVARGALRDVMDELREVGSLLRAKPEQSVIDAARETVLALDISEALRSRADSVRQDADFYRQRCALLERVLREHGLEHPYSQPVNRKEPT